MSTQSPGPSFAAQAERPAERDQPAQRVRNPAMCQYFGPTARHERGCVEVTFAHGDDTAVPAALAEGLVGFGFKLGEPLSADRQPIERAVCEVARAILATQAGCWSSHGREGDRAWVATGFRFPSTAARVLEFALTYVLTGGVLSPTSEQAATRLAEWLKGWMRTGLRMRVAADTLGLATTQVSISADTYQIGRGSRGLHFHQAGNERDSLTGAILERKKHHTVETLNKLRLPTTRGRLVRSAAEAVEAARSIGFPCVVKPDALGQGIGVSTHLTTERQVAEAFALAQSNPRAAVLVEKQVEGHDHRMLVVGGELLWVLRRTPATVTGDGTSTVVELIESENRRRITSQGGDSAYLYPIEIGEELRQHLAGRYALEPSSVLEAGREIDVIAQANVARGGSLEDVSDQVHPDNRALAVRVSRLVRIGTIGIDLMTTDISRSWKEGGSAIIEVNRHPGTGDIGDPMLMVRTLFPNRLSGRIPSVAVVGSEAYRARAAEAAAAAFADAGLRLATADYLPGNVASPSTITSSGAPPSVELATLDPEVDALLVPCDPALVESRGFPLQSCDLLLIEEAQAFPWLARVAGETFSGEVAEKKIAAAVGKLVRRYSDPAEGGPLPVVEIVAGDAAPDKALKVKVWRCRTMPRAWFFAQLGLDAPPGSPLVNEAHLLDAVKQVADRALEAGGGAALREGFAHDPLPVSWMLITFEAEIALPSGREDAARAALLAAVDRVNEAAAAKIG